MFGSLWQSCPKQPHVHQKDRKTHVGHEREARHLQTRHLDERQRVAAEQKVVEEPPRRLASGRLRWGGSKPLGLQGPMLAAAQWDWLGWLRARGNGGVPAGTRDACGTTPPRTGRRRRLHGGKATPCLLLLYVATQRLGSLHLPRRCVVPVAAAARHAGQAGSKRGAVTAGVSEVHSQHAAQRRTHGRKPEDCVERRPPPHPSWAGTSACAPSGCVPASSACSAARSSRMLPEWV